MKKENKITLGYIRVSIDHQLITNQKMEILEYCRTRNLKIDNWVELTVSSRKFSEDKKFRKILDLKKGDILISTEISELGRSTSEVLNLLNQMLKNEVRIIFTKQNFDINIIDQKNITKKMLLTIFSILAELEKKIISLRIKENISAKKKQGIYVGKKKGTIQSSIYDKKKDQITFLLSKKISIPNISKIIEVGKPRSLLIYLNKRKLRIEKK